MPFGIGGRGGGRKVSESVIGAGGCCPSPNGSPPLAILLSQVGSQPVSQRHSPTTVHRLAPFNYTVSFAYSGPGKPVCLHHTFGPKQFDIHVREYEIGPYLLDPFYKATANGIRSGVYKLAELAPDQFYKSEYYKSYYVQTGPVDEIAFFTPGKDGWTVVNVADAGAESAQFLGARLAHAAHRRAAGAPHRRDALAD